MTKKRGEYVLANQKIDPEIATRIEQIQRELGNGFVRPRADTMLRMRTALEQHQAAYTKYDKFILAPFPEDYPVAVKGKLILREKDDIDAAPFVTIISDMTPAFKRSDVRRARQDIIRNEDSFDHVTLTDNEWKDLVSREANKRNELPPPYYHEALRDFTIRMEDGDVIPFCRSKLPRIKYNDYDIIPMVDSLINNERGQTTMFGLGLINVEEDIYQVAVYWFGNVSSSYHENIVNILLGYFYAQWAFHACPERVIEVRPGDPNPFEEDTAATPERSHTHAQQKPSKTSIARTIYIRDYPAGKRRAIERRCRCWYVHGYMRTYRKTGKQVWVEGYFKGPDRDDPTARQHTKNYVMN